MSEMIERVADGLYPLMHESDRDHVRAIARAAIEAMREPTEAMVAAAEKLHWAKEHSGAADNCSAMYRAMIDAALGEPDR